LHSGKSTAFFTYGDFGLILVAQLLQLRKLHVGLPLNGHVLHPYLLTHAQWQDVLVELLLLLLLLLMMRSEVRIVEASG